MALSNCEAISLYRNPAPSDTGNGSNLLAEEFYALFTTSLPLVYKLICGVSYILYNEELCDLQI
jgi:hypothetical protein